MLNLSIKKIDNKINNIKKICNELDIDFLDASLNDSLSKEEVFYTLERIEKTLLKQKETDINSIPKSDLVLNIK